MNPLTTTHNTNSYVHCVMHKIVIKIGDYKSNHQHTRLGIWMDLNECDIGLFVSYSLLESYRKHSGQSVIYYKQMEILNINVKLITN